MAAEVGVSPVTMNREVKRLASDGILSVRQRKGIHVLPSVPLTDDTEPLQPRGWRLVAEELEHDIRAGQFPHSRLPLKKELCERYGCAHKTLQKALVHLATKEVVCRQGMALHAARSSIAPSHSEVVFAARARNSGQRFITSRSDDQFNFLRHECRQRGIKASPLLLPTAMPMRDIERQLRDRLKRAEVLGVVFKPEGFPSGHEWSALCPLLTRLTSRSRPLVLLDETWAHLPREPHAHVLSIGFKSNRDVGRELGRFLLSKGHRHIAFFTATPRQEWSRQRLAGLRESVQSEGGTVLDFRTRAPEFIDTLPEPLSSDVTHVCRDVRAKYGLSPVSATKGRLRATVEEALCAEFRFEVLTPLFDKALRTPNVTGWVGARDSVALDAMLYLRWRKINVPERISVLGCDDSAESSLAELTTYRFDNLVLVKSVLEHILWPRVRGGRHWHTKVIGGGVIARGTTGVVRA